MGKQMCLLKVYLEEYTGRKLIARDVALIVKEGDIVSLKSIELEEVATLEEVDVSLIDTLNSVMILKPKA
jgi:predicted RNA-binding protein